MAHVRVLLVRRRARDASGGDAAADTPAAGDPAGKGRSGWKGPASQALLQLRPRPRGMWDVKAAGASAQLGKVRSGAFTLCFPVSYGRKFP